MVNNRTLEEELQNIDNYFQSISIEDLESTVQDCGINEILPSKDNNYVKATTK